MSDGCTPVGIVEEKNATKLQACCRCVHAALAVAMDEKARASKHDPVVQQKRSTFVKRTETCRDRSAVAVELV